MPTAHDRRSGVPFRETRCHHGAISFDDFRQPVIQRPDDPPALGVMRRIKLLYLLGMAPRAIGRRHNDGDQLAVMIKRIGLPFVGHVALITSHIRTKVFAGPPLLIDDRRLVLMTGQTIFGLRTDFSRQAGLCVNSRTHQRNSNENDAKNGFCHNSIPPVKMVHLLYQSILSAGDIRNNM